MEDEVYEITCIHEARRIIILLHRDVINQFYGKCFFAALSIITGASGLWIGLFL